MEVVLITDWDELNKIKEVERLVWENTEFGSMHNNTDET